MVPGMRASSKGQIGYSLLCPRARHDETRLGCVLPASWRVPFAGRRPCASSRAHERTSRWLSPRRRPRRPAATSAARPTASTAVAERLPAVPLAAPPASHVPHLRDVQGARDRAGRGVGLRWASPSRSQSMRWAATMRRTRPSRARWRPSRPVRCTCSCAVRSTCCARAAAATRRPDRDRRRSPRRSATTRTRPSRCGRKPDSVARASAAAWCARAAPRPPSRRARPAR